MPQCARALFLSFLMVTVTLTMALPAAAVDGDGDGIDDEFDDCPFASGNSTTGYTGCPDNDGNGQPNFVGATTGDWSIAPRELYDSSGSTRAVDWAPGSIYVAGAGDGDVLLFNAAGIEVAILATISENVRSLAFSPNGSYLAVGGYYSDDQAHSWALVLEMNWISFTATTLVNLSSLHNGHVFALEWSPSGDALYTACADMQVRKFDVNNWNNSATYTMADPAYNIAVSPDGRLIATVHGEELSVNWTSNGTQYMNVHHHSATTLAVDFSPDGRWIITGSDDTWIRVYNATNKSVQVAWDAGSRDVNQISFDPMGGFFAVATDGTSAQLYRTSDWTYITNFGSFGWSQNTRGTRALDWSDDGMKIAFAQNRGRTSAYVLPEGHLQLKGDVTSELMMWRWRSNWPTDGRPLSHSNLTATQVTQGLCNGDDFVGTITHGAPHHLAVPQTDWETSGLLNCSLTSRELLEVPVGRMPASLFVQQGGAAHTCLQSIGGLSMAQLRWIFSAADSATLSQSGWAPGMDLASVAPFNDGDGVKEWSDLNSSCTQEGLHVTGRWDNRSVPMMMERLLTCSDCQFAEGFFTSTNQRYRFQEEHRSQILISVAATDHLLGFTEMKVGLSGGGLWQVPIADNWTHSAADHISAGGVMVGASVDNSSNGTWPVQDDYLFIIDNSTLVDRFSLLDWMMSDSARFQWDDIGFVNLGPLARVQAWARLGYDASHLLPDTDNDGIWDGDDDCPNTLAEWQVDAVGCAQNQRDNDGDGYYNHEDDCVDEYGTSSTPLVGCLDTDGDGWMDTSDAFPNDSSQWYDSDSDGFGDNASGNNADDCTDVAGTSSNDRVGCPDSDGDGWSDEDGDWTIADGADEFPIDPVQWIDTDDDGWGDNHSFTIGEDGLRENEVGDAYIDDPTQWHDTDGDGYGDNEDGNSADDCPLAAGLSYEDKLGCPDSDLDGWSDENDAFPDEQTQWSDLDSDGFGDNWQGTSPDQCQETPFAEVTLVNEQGCGPSERDSDFDGIVDSLDACPNTPIDEAAWVRINGCSESESDDDGDGVANPDDLYPEDPTQWADSDGDGYPDNPNGTNGDDCAGRAGTSYQDRRGCADQDQDGYSDPDSEWGVTEGADAWASEPTQWSDADGDGFYDNWDDSTWNATRLYTWPGEFVPGALRPDKCPLNASEFAFPEPGCPERQVSGPTTGTGSSGSGTGVPVMLWVILVLIVLGITGLVAAVMMQRNKPPKSKQKLDQAIDIIEQAADDWEHGAEVSEAPSWDLQGELSEDGYEWLEWPANSDNWWYRDESGYWARYD